MEHGFWSLCATDRTAVDQPRGWLVEPGRSLRRPGRVMGWTRPTTTRHHTYEGRPWIDAVGATNLPMLCSEPLCTLITGLLGPDDVVQWLPVEVIDASNGTSREYWMLRLPQLLEVDVLDVEQTVWSPCTIMEVVLDARQMVDRHVIRYPRENRCTAIVSQRVRGAIEEAGLTGCKFEPVRASHLDEVHPGN